MSMNKKVVEELDAAALEAAKSLPKWVDYKDWAAETQAQFYRRAPEEVIEAAEGASMPSATQTPGKFMEWWREQRENSP